MTDPITLLLYLLVFGVIVWLALWIIGQSFPAPVAQVARIVVGLLALLVILAWVFGRVPVPALVHR